MSGNTKVLDGLRYTSDHEWAALEGDVVSVGITDYAQDALGDITFVELPAVGRVLAARESFGVVESVKTFSDLYAPVGGEVVEVNQAVLDDPASINSNPYGDNWLVRIRLQNPAELDALLDSDAYRKHIDHAG